MSNESRTETLSEGSRIVEISRQGGDALGAAVFLTATQLSELGIDLEDTDFIVIQLSEGRIEVSVYERSKGERLCNAAD